jgi:hypothetical protein
MATGGCTNRPRCGLCLSSRSLFGRSGIEAVQLPQVAREIIHTDKYQSTGTIVSHVAFRPALCSLEPKLGDLGVETVSSLRGTHQERWGAKPPTFQKGLRGPWGHPDPQKDRSPTIEQCKIPSQSTATLIKRSNGGQGVLYQCLIPGGTAAPQTPRTLQGGSGPWQGSNPLRSSSENLTLGVRTASSLREIHQLRWGGGFAPHLD